MAVQQVKKSKQKVRSRRGANRYQGIKTGICSNCKAVKLPHRVCGSCGYYGDRQVLTTESE